MNESNAITLHNSVDHCFETIDVNNFFFLLLLLFSQKKKETQQIKLDTTKLWLFMETHPCGLLITILFKPVNTVYALEVHDNRAIKK
jgi:hypothetical protein